MNHVSVDLSDEASQDILEIFAYIEQASPQNAWLVLDAIERGFELLATMPLAGHIRSEIDDVTIRFWSVKSFVIAYRFDGNHITVIRVIHGARDFKTLAWP